MSAIQTINEVTFARAYLQLLSTHSSGKQLDDDFTKDPATLPVRPLVVLPNMPNEKKRHTETSVSKSSVNVQLKSIKGVKFTWTTKTESDSTVLAVKEKLIQDASGPLKSTDAKYAPDNLRFLIKGKVVPDLKTLDDIATAGDNGELNVVFTVMVSEPTGGATPDPEPVASAPKMLNDSAWAELNRVLVDHLGEAEASTVLAKFKASVA